MLSSVGLKKKDHILSSLEVGSGVLARKSLKTKKAGEAISGNFVKTNLDMHIVCISLGV